MRHLVFISVALSAFCAPAAADTLIATRTLRANSIVTPQDVSIIPDNIPGMAQSLAEVVGLETRSIIYAGRPIALGNLGPAAIIERNQVVPLVFVKGGLKIYVDARSLERAGPGDVIRVMNLASKNTVTGVVAADGSVHVGGLTAHY